VTKSKVTCAGGCEVSPPGVEDICHDAPAPHAGADAGSADAGVEPPTVPGAAVTTDDAAAPPTSATAESAAPLAIASPDAGGCSTSSGPVGSGGVWLLLVAGVALARRKLSGTRPCSRSTWTSSR
jgi:MYXO-CTERM domain-containing protein